jgi:hypothetical protein
VHPSTEGLPHLSFSFFEPPYRLPKIKLYLLTASWGTQAYAREMPQVPAFKYYEKTGSYAGKTFLSRL